MNLVIVGSMSTSRQPSQSHDKVRRCHLCVSSDSRPLPCRCIAEQGIGQTSGQRLIVICKSFMVPSVRAPAR